MKSNSFGMSRKNIKVINLAFLRHEFHVFYPQVGLDFSRHDGDCHASSDLYTKLLSFNLKEVFEKYPLLTHDFNDETYFRSRNCSRFFIPSTQTKIENLTEKF